ncbi:phosphoglycerate dehydrogenase [Metabacillus sp. GX 13764]|uniref:phosphoglycerate dehydrogenase n=1 Tax=Metabacillus kandeliae TaxID=2900151 RepID=UPI001E33C8AB|nr:phosphoglycerate dehydrogenase [Metabacillus kandeliae]
MFRILVSDPISKDGLLPLMQSDQLEIVQKNVKDAEDELDQFDALLVRSATKVTQSLMEKMPKLKIIARAGVGVDNIDIDQATRHGIIVINAPEGNTISTAEHTFAMIMSLMRHIPQANASVKDNEWKRSSFLGTELYGKVLGIAGLGRIGSEIAKRARAFGMKVVVFDPFLTEERASKIGVESYSFHQLLEEADIITVHTPLTKETRGLLNHETIGKTKKGVYLVNCARGGIIDEEALIYYLENGHVSGAALDVFIEEPPAGNRLLDFPQVITTPHLGASTKEAQLNVASQVAKEVLTFCEGGQVTSSVNLPSLSEDDYKIMKPYDLLARKMGGVLSQCMREPVNSISVQYEGTVADLETSFITKSVIASFLRSRVDVTVNAVNAGMIARERGISFSEKKSANESGYANCVTVRVEGDRSTFEIKGAYIPEYGVRIINLNGFSIDFYPEGHLLYVQHTDVPGVIGRVGQILGDHAVNIATMQVGRKERGGEAIMMLSFDKPLENDVLDAFREVGEIVSVLPLEL